jgi:hypothetical protein
MGIGGPLKPVQPIKAGERLVVPEPWGLCGCSSRWLQDLSIELGQPQPVGLPVEIGFAGGLGFSL